MTTIEIEQKDSVYLKINCEKSTAKELSSFFTFSVPNYQYTPAFRNKFWDGKIRLFNTTNYTIYAGLLDYIIQFANDRNYQVIDKTNKPSISITKEQVAKFMNEYLQPYCVDSPMVAHEHQVNAVQNCLTALRSLVVSPTGSGKSFVIYALIRYFLDYLPKEKKILILVPTTGLVAQMFNDFKDYSSKNDWDVDENCHVIYAGQSKDTRKRIIISTWQSLFKMNEKYFEKFGAVIGDECHLFKAKSLTTIMTKLKNCDIRIGTTGTLDGTQTHKLMIEGLFGTVFKATSTKELMDNELLSNLDIECVVLKYSEDECRSTKKMIYQDEIKWIVTNKKRNTFIKNLACKLKENTLVLFNYVDTHGIPLYNEIKKHCSDRNVFFISGGTDVAQREAIRKIVDKESNAILVASYGTCSTGINIKNINNIIFASPSKSVIRVLQSIGRGLRRTEKKNNVKLFDISDDLRHKKYVNHTLRHLNERIKLYTKEDFDYKLIKINLQEAI